MKLKSLDDLKLFRIYYFIISMILPNLIFSQGSLLLVGGGNDDKFWAREPYRWFVVQADSGKIINIDVNEASPWYANTFISHGADPSSHPMQIPTTAVANDSATFQELISATGIFIEGGDQWDYVSTWKGTLVQDAIHLIFNRGGVIAGTSAGLAVLGEVVFDAKYGSAYPEQVAYNPYHSRVHFTDDFLKILPNVLTDSHFHPRGRLGRLVPMLARRIQDNGNMDLMAIGVDENTALSIDPDKIASVYGEGAVTILYRSEHSRVRCQPNQPVSFTHLHYDQLIHGARYDLAARTLIDGGLYMQPVNPNASPRSYRHLLLDGSSDSTAFAGEIVVTNLTSNSLDAWYGRLILAAGNALVPDAVIIPKLYNNTDYSENRIIAGIYGTAMHPGFHAIYLDDGCQVTISDDGELTTNKLVYVLDTRNITHAGVNQARRTNYSGLAGAELHFLSANDTLSLTDDDVGVAVDFDRSEPAESIIVYHAYPNPCNHELFISFQLLKPAQVRLEIVNILGETIEILADRQLNAGVQRMYWDAGHVSSGIYFCRVRTSDFYDVQKCVIVK